jgi:hypothetical protein
MISALRGRPSHTMDARKPSTLAFDTLVFDAARLPPDAETIDKLAKLQVAAHRLGVELLLRNASNPLCELISFVGLADVLRVEMKRETEQREQRGGVEEERELDNPAR